jgi:hypothetical protein
MCLFIKRGCKPEIAQKDILCYKLVEDHVRYWKPRIRAFNVKYPYNKILTAESYSYSDNELRLINHLEIRNWIICGNIRETIEYGFHADYDCGRRLGSVPCIIPKGTEYCLGESDDIVAVNMIVFRSTLSYYWYKIKKLWQE